MCRAKYPLQIGVFELQEGEGSRTRFLVGKIGLTAHASDEGQANRNTSEGPVKVKDMTESTEGEQEVMGMG